MNLLFGSNDQKAVIKLTHAPNLTLSSFVQWMKYIETSIIHKYNLTLSTIISKFRDYLAKVHMLASMKLICAILKLSKVKEKKKE